MFHQRVAGRGREHERIVAKRRVLEVRNAIVERDDGAVELGVVCLIEQRPGLFLAPDQSQVRQAHSERARHLR